MPTRAIHIDRLSGVPIYRQIVDQVKHLVAAGRLAPGAQLDSVRVLARRLHINPMTVAKAYSRLIGQGVIAPRQGSGVFVVRPGRAELTPAAKRQMLADLLDHVVAEAIQLDVNAPEVGDLLRARFAAAPGPAAGVPSRPAPGRLSRPAPIPPAQAAAPAGPVATAARAARVRAEQPAGPAAPRPEPEPPTELEEDVSLL